MDQDTQAIARRLDDILANCERLRLELGQQWDLGKPTFFYLDRNMGWAEDELRRIGYRGQ